MALNYYYTDVVNSTEVMFDENDYMLADSQSIIFGTMSVGMHEITEKNCYEFYARMRIVYKINGWDVIPLSRIKQHIGLRTNVGDETRAQWLKRWFTYELDDTIYEAKRDERESECVT